MATQNIVAMSALQTSTGGPPMRLDLPESSSNSDLIGAVQVFTSGYVDTAGADPAAILGILDEPGNNSSSNGDTNISVIIAQPGTIFQANLAQAASDTTGADTDIGTAYGIIVRSSGTAHWVIDSSETGNTRLSILEKASIVGVTPGNDQVVTDDNVRFNFMFFVANCVATS